MGFATDFANEILDMQDEIAFLRRENEHLKQMVEKYHIEQEESFAHSRQMIGTVLTALIDPDSGINKTARIVNRARLAGITED